MLLVLPWIYYNMLHGFHFTWFTSLHYGLFLFFVFFYLHLFCFCHCEITCWPTCRNLSNCLEIHSKSSLSCHGNSTTLQVARIRRMPISCESKIEPFSLHKTLQFKILRTLQQLSCTTELLKIICEEENPILGLVQMGQLAVYDRMGKSKNFHFLHRINARSVSFKVELVLAMKPIQTFYSIL